MVDDYGVCDYYTVQNESGVNMVGALNAEGTLVVPMEYGDIDFLSDRWAMAVKLEVTDGADYDYEALFGDENYIVTAYDFYDLAAGAMIGTLSRDEMRSAEAYGDYIFVMDHADNVTIYDAAFTAVGSADSLYDAYASSDEGVVYLPTGEVVAARLPLQQRSGLRPALRGRRGLQLRRGRSGGQHRRALRRVRLLLPSST